MAKISMNKKNATSLIVGTAAAIAGARLLSKKRAGRRNDAQQPLTGTVA